MDAIEYTLKNLKRGQHVRVVYHRAGLIHVRTWVVEWVGPTCVGFTNCMSFNYVGRQTDNPNNYIEKVEVLHD